MIEIQAINRSDDEQQAFVQQVLKQCFPFEEYRDFEEFKDVIRHKKEFICNIVMKDEDPIGIFNYWNLPHFIFIEHFAILPENRDKSLGLQTMNLFLEQAQLPIILEVEPPETEIQKRRIAFYERLGFHLWTSEYVQPPYRSDFEGIPMQLMCYGKLSEIKKYKHVRTQIYKSVYRVLAIDPDDIISITYPKP